MKKAVVILSGGLDSTTVLYYVMEQGYDPYPITFDYGQKHIREIECAVHTCEKLGIGDKHLVVDMSGFGEVAKSSLTVKDWEVPEGHYEDEVMRETVVPNRNMVMISIATAYAITNGAKEVFNGAHSGDHAVYPDCRPEFVFRMNDVLKLCDYEPVHLEVPFMFFSKENIVAIGEELGVPFENTWSCYNGGELPCGKCGTCVERIEAFKRAGVKDKLEYEVE